MSDEQESGASAVSVDEAKIEELLSEKLMTGYELLDSSCPVCSTPLIKNNNLSEEEISGHSRESSHSGKPFKPVAGVPMCVVCRSHVVTQESEISILERCESLKDKGSILLAIESGSSVGDSKYSEDVSDVLISVESKEKDGEDNEVEVVSSPRAGDPAKPIFVDDKTLVRKDGKNSFDDTTVEGPSIIQTKTDVEGVMEEYSVR
ncbi:MAG: hypothetical protein SGILL_008666 [Bacillariaceae sp.]